MIWLVKIMSDDLPAIEAIDLDYIAVIDLHLATQWLGISKNDMWVEGLLASRIARNPWECLSRAWRPPRIDMDLAQAIIRLLSTHDLIRFAAKDQFVESNVTLHRLCSYSFNASVTHNFPGGQITVDIPPLFALGVAITRVREQEPDLDQEAAGGDAEALRLLMVGISWEFSHAWNKLYRLAGSAPWMLRYS